MAANTITKNDLIQARRMKAAISGKQEQILQLRTMAERTACAWGGGDPQRMAKTVETMVDFEREVARQVEQLTGMQQRIQGVIAKVPDSDCRAILVLYYLGGYNWGQVADIVCYSERHTRRLRDKALREIQKIQKKEH